MLAHRGRRDGRRPGPRPRSSPAPARAARRARRPRRAGRPARGARRRRRPGGDRRPPRSSTWTTTRPQGVRRKKDSSLVRAAEAVRDGRASAMVSAGNTGATMASALLRMGRIKGVARPAIATPIPVPRADTPTVLLDAGANAECQPAWLVQFAQMGAVFARAALRHRRRRRSACCRSARSRARATRWSRRPTPCWPSPAGPAPAVDVRRQRRGPRPPDRRGRRRRHRRLHRQRRAQDPRGRRCGSLVDALSSAPSVHRRGRAAPPTSCCRRCCPSTASSTPTPPAGPCCSGVDGVCIISHGSSSARAIVNAVAGGRRDGGGRPGRATWPGRSPALALRTACRVPTPAVHKRTSSETATARRVPIPPPGVAPCLPRPTSSRAR